MLNGLKGRFQCLQEDRCCQSARGAKHVAGSLDTEIPSEKYRLGRIADSPWAHYVQTHETKVALNFPTSRAGTGRELAAGPASRLNPRFDSNIHIRAIS
jgi:hypothetical protein